MNPKEKDNEIIELTDEELKQILPMISIWTLSSPTSLTPKSGTTRRLKSWHR